MQTTDQTGVTSRDRAYLHTVAAGAVLPLIQAGVSSVATGILVLIILSSTRVRNFITWAGVVMIIIFILVWIILQRHWITLTAERVTKLDLNRDGIIGEPETLRIEVTDRKPGAWNQQIYNFPATAEEMRMLAMGVNSGTGFKEAYWTGSGAPFSQVKFRRLMSFLLGSKLIEPNGRSSNQGYKLTDLGGSIFERLAPPPPPLADVKP
jgi:hypothetical protein